MALVRRADLLGTAPPRPLPATVPAQSPPGGADAPPSSLTSALPAWAANAEAAAVAGVLQRYGTHAGPFKIGSPTSAYAGVVVFAGAVERAGASGLIIRAQD